MPAGDEIALEKGKQDIPAPVQNRTDLEEVEKKRLDADLNFGGVPEPSRKVATSPLRRHLPIAAMYLASSRVLATHSEEAFGRGCGRNSQTTSQTRQ